jgi:energy-coupling factor transporter ATP-binding protein EcfA2
MATQQFRASLSRGRKSWCMIFRHPLRPASDGRPGLRIRRGLGIDDTQKAQVLVDQMNELLVDESYWKASMRENASRRFEPRIVAAFYEDIETKAEDPWAVRDEVVPIPGPHEGYARALLVGPTGAGKTTLLRQLIGSHPKRDRFPSISTAKTTIFDTEIVFDSAPYRCVVSFLPRDRVRSYIEECVIAAVSAGVEGSDDDLVLRRLLEHSEQRFRLSYLLGTVLEGRRGEEEEGGDDDSDDLGSETAVTETGPPEIGEEERARMESVLRSFLQRVSKIADALRTELAAQLDIDLSLLKPEDQDSFVELVESSLFENEEAQQLVDDILDEVESKFMLLKEGSYERDQSEWPRRWSYETPDRDPFIRAINRFSSNYAPHFGRLLAPVVQGMRVAGPFRPVWQGSDSNSSRFVLIDGEGLGHAPASAFTLPTSITRRYEIADVILLVDSATQPMQASAQAVLRSISASGHDSKAAVLFTHFDQVRGDNLPNLTARKNHVWASLENAINAVDEAVTLGAGKKLKRHLKGRVFFVSQIQEVLSEGAHQTRNELCRLVAVFQAASERKKKPIARPVYDLANLVLCVHSATQQFHDQWNARLGFTYSAEVQTEHWTRVKALARRFANQWEDQYDTLRPVADMIRLLSERLAHFISKPRSWDPPDAGEEEREIATERVAQEVYSALHKLLSERFSQEHLNEWVTAYAYRGTGSTRLRSRDIRGIYESASPILAEAPNPDASSFLDAIRDLFREAASKADAEIIE